MNIPAHSSVTTHVWKMSAEHLSDIFSSIASPCNSIPSMVSIVVLLKKSVATSFSDCQHPIVGVSHNEASFTQNRFSDNSESQSIGKTTEIIQDNALLAEPYEDLECMDVCVKFAISRTQNS